MLFPFSGWICGDFRKKTENFVGDDGDAMEELHKCFNKGGSKNGLKLLYHCKSIHSKSREKHHLFSVHNISTGRWGVGHFLHFLCQQQGPCGFLGHFSLGWTLVCRTQKWKHYLQQWTIQEISCIAAKLLNPLSLNGCQKLDVKTQDLLVIKQRLNQQNFGRKNSNCWSPLRKLGTPPLKDIWRFSRSGCKPVFPTFGAFVSEKTHQSL